MTVHEMEPRLAKLLQRVVAGKEPIYYVGDQSWDKVFSGNVEFVAGGWRLVFFNDCSSLDYIDSVTTPEGHTFDFDDMYRVIADFPGVDNLNDLDQVLSEAPGVRS